MSDVEDEPRDLSLGEDSPVDDLPDDDDGDIKAIPSESAGSLTDEPILLTVEARAHGWRLDHFLARLFPNYSRSLLQKAIEQQRVLLNGLPVKMSRRTRVNDIVSIRLPQIPDQNIPPEDIPLDVLFEDASMVAINKPAGLIVHPGKGHYGGTLCGALQFHFDRLSDAAGRFRPGIVHRLDRDTSGVILVAKDNQVHGRLSSQFERREVRKEYRALVWGEIDRDSDYIETHMRVNPRHREKMQVCNPEGNSREAVTYYEVLERFPGISYVRLRPRTGRTHQLRVHMLHIGHPILADRLYGGQQSFGWSDVPGGKAPDGGDDVLIVRQALHAFRIEFQHPVSNADQAIEAPLATDFLNTLAALRG